ncbi:MAG: TraB/GumN family protein [Leadbetterella sp.]
MSGNGLQKKSYLFGTMHVFCESQASMSSELKSIIENSEGVYLEMNFDENTYDFQLNYSYYLKNGKTLSKYYSEKEYLKLEKSFNTKYVGKKLHDYEDYKPDMIISFVVSRLYNCHYLISYNEIISRVAKRKNIKIYGFDSMLNQVEDDEVAIKESAKFLYSLLTEPTFQDSVRTKYKEVTKHYLNQDITSLNKFLITNNSSITSLVQDEINEKWASKMIQISKETSALFTFSADKLAGEYGLINLLRKEGYTVVPLTKKQKR